MRDDKESGEELTLESPVVLKGPSSSEERAVEEQQVRRPRRVLKL
jgi:hypothetical protein